MKKILLLGIAVCTFTTLSACSNETKTSTNSENKHAAKTEYTINYSVNGSTFNVPESWSEKDGKDGNTKYFYPKDGMLLVLFSEVSPSIRSENARTEYLSGIKKGSLKNFTEKDGQEIGDDAYGWNVSYELNEASYNGAMIVVNVKGGILQFIMGTTDQTFETYRDAFNAIYQSLKYSPRSTDTSQPEASSQPAASTEQSKPEKATFSPTDTSDATIEAISTYGDYLTMTQKIIDEYLVNYENAFRGTYLESSLSEQRSEYAAAFDEQKKLYGNMTKQNLSITKSSLVDYLKTYRDTLNDYINRMKALVQ